MDSGEKSQRVCPLCGRRFTCFLERGEDVCWCWYLPAVMAVGGVEEGCYCPQCLRERVEAMIDGAVDEALFERIAACAYGGSGLAALAGEGS